MEIKDFLKQAGIFSKMKGLMRLNPILMKNAEVQGKIKNTTIL